MPTSNIPSDKRRPGTFLTFDFTSGAHGLTPVQRSVALIGMKHSSGTATVNTPVQVANELEANTYFGAGSELALMVRAALATVRKLGASGPQIWCVPIAEPAGTTATRTFTVTGPATASGNAELRVAGRTVLVPIKSGDSANTIAAAIDAAMDTLIAKGELPGTVGSATNVATFSYRHVGINGADLKASVVSTPAGVSIVAAVGVAGSGVADIQPALDVLGSRDYLAVAIANHAAQDVTDLGEHMDAMWASSKKRWRHAFLAETGSLATATTLASSPNRPEIVVVSFEQGRNLPGEIAAAIATMTQCRERPSYNWDGTELSLYPTDDSYVYEDAEVETALAGGVTPLTLTDAGNVRLERLITTKATLSGAAFENLRDYQVTATMAYYARQIDAKVAPALQGANADSTLEKKLHDITYAVLKRGEELGDLHHVDDHAAEILVAAHEDIPTRLLIEVPASVVPNAHQADTTMRLYVEAA